MKKTLIALAIITGLAVIGLAQNYVRIQQAADTVSAPSLVSVNDSNAVTVYSTNASRSVGRVLYRSVQNMGTIPVYFAINSTVSATNYHGILRPGIRMADGLGAILECGDTPFPVTLLCTTPGTTTVSVIEFKQN
jgi:hypothetical protein